MRTVPFSRASAYEACRRARVAQSRVRSYVFVDLRSESFYFITETHSLPNAHSLLPSQLCLDHSHCLVLAPATLAALPSTRAIPDRDVFYVAPPVRSILTRSLPALTRSYPRHFTFYVAHPIRSIETE